MDNHKFVFIGGLHRSGTSVFFKCLREHPLISGFTDSGSPEDEGQHLQPVYTTAKAHGGPGKFGFDPSSHLDETSELVSENYAQKLFSEWSSYWVLEKPFLIREISTQFGAYPIFTSSLPKVLFYYSAATSDCCNICRA